MSSSEETTVPTAGDRRRATAYLPSHTHLAGGVAQAIADERARVLDLVDVYAAGAARRVAALPDEMKAFRDHLAFIDGCLK